MITHCLSEGSLLYYYLLYSRNCSDYPFRLHASSYHGSNYHSIRPMNRTERLEFSPQYFSAFSRLGHPFIPTSTSSFNYILILSHHTRVNWYTVVVKLSCLFPSTLSCDIAKLDAVSRIFSRSDFKFQMKRNHFLTSFKQFWFNHPILWYDKSQGILQFYG